MSTKYEAVIGLEIHVQLRTKTKMFSSAPYRYGAETNSLTDPVVLAQFNAVMTDEVKENYAKFLKEQADQNKAS